MPLPKSVQRWAFYSFANHSYQVVYVSFLLPVLFSSVLLHRGYSLSAWGAANGISTVLGVAIAVVVGRYSDKHSKLQAFRWAIVFSFLGMLAISFAVSRVPGMLFWLLIATNSVFIWSLALSDSILPHVSDNASSYEYGGFAWGFGYVGGIASMIVALALQHFTGEYSFWVLVSVPIFYIVFSVYSLSGLRVVNFHATKAEHGPRSISKRSKGILFLGYWLISECITVISLFAALYLSNEKHFSAIQVGASILLLQAIAFPATWLGGKLVAQYGTLRLLGVTIIFWGIGLVSFVVLNLGLFGLLLAIVLFGLAYGNTQSYLRSQYSTLIEPSESGFQFGIYSAISEAAVFIGPIVFGFASDTLHSEKIPLLALFVLMAVGYALIWKIMQRAVHPQVAT